MFYFYEVLQKRGKFGLIWLAATAPKRLNKREADTVNVVRSAQDVMDILTRYQTTAGQRNVHFSLYLSSQLMFGLAKINRIQSEILMEDVKNLAGRLCSFRRHMTTNIDLEEPTTGFRVTLEEPDFENVPMDFGSFTLHDIATDPTVSLENFFLVVTPRGSSAGSSGSSGSDQWRFFPGPADRQRGPLDAYLAEAHTVSPDRITLQDFLAAPEPLDVELSDSQSSLLPELKIEVTEQTDGFVRLFRDRFELIDIDSPSGTDTEAAVLLNIKSRKRKAEDPRIDEAYTAPKTEYPSMEDFFHSSQTKENVSGPSPRVEKRPRKTDSRKRKAEESSIDQAYTDSKSARNKKKDEFDYYGEYIANVMRRFGKKNFSAIKREFSEIIFKAELDFYSDS